MIGPNININEPVMASITFRFSGLQANTGKFKVPVEYTIDASGVWHAGRENPEQPNSYILESTEYNVYNSYETSYYISNQPVYGYVEYTGYYQGTCGVFTKYTCTKYGTYWKYEIIRYDQVYVPYSYAVAPRDIVHQVKLHISSLSPSNNSPLVIDPVITNDGVVQQSDQIRKLQLDPNNGSAIVGFSFSQDYNLGPSVNAGGDLDREATSPDTPINFSVTVTDDHDLDPGAPTCNVASTEDPEVVIATIIGTKVSPGVFSVDHTYAIGDYTISCEATDSESIKGSDTLTLKVEDRTAPQIPTVDMPIRLEATASDGAVLNLPLEAFNALETVSTPITWRCTYGTTEDAGPTNATLPITFPLQHKLPLGSTNVKCTVMDSRGNVSDIVSKTIEVQDTTAPALVMPSDLSFDLLANEATKSVKLPVVEAIDLVDPAAAVTCKLGDAPVTATMPFGPGVHKISCTAQDATGNVSDTHEYSITVKDVTAPTLTMPDTIVHNLAANTATFAFTVLGPTTVNDAVDASPTVACTPAKDSQASLGVGTHTINCTAKDASGNIGKGSYNVTVKDVTAPTLSLNNLTVNGGNAPTMAVTYPTANVNATDAVDSTPTIECSPSSGAMFPIGTTYVSCTAQDDAGNHSTPSTFTVTVLDKVAPTVNVPSNITTTATGASGAAVKYIVTATDVISGDVTARVQCNPPSGSTFAVTSGVHTVTCTATDEAGNKSAPASFTVEVNYAFNGFFQPVDMGGIFNKAKAGSAIPVKFTLGGDQGLEVLAGTPIIVGVACPSGTANVDLVEETVVASNSGLKWDGTQYVYVWKTDSRWAGQCLQLSVLLKDGSIAKTALFQLTK
ncbi:PxKF domain-containing protein [Deinococcus yavapaiensis]|nr:PxKF domain-containing protein [Deinococcus yavapaiensis]